MQIRVEKVYDYRVISSGPKPCPFDHDCIYCIRYYFGYHGAVSPCGIQQWLTKNVYVVTSPSKGEVPISRDKLSLDYFYYFPWSLNLW